MACVILPSETARLVYGYLVKENLNDIALQFLESSPYLMDCCQIVKSGYQFNTKLMGKDLPELLQEYSVMHNLVNNKISHLCKTSLLYKRIKLRCESLPEILELILFWKNKSSKSEDGSSHNGKTEKNSSGLEINTTCEYTHLNDVSQVKVGENPSDSTCVNKNNSNSVQRDSTTIPESYNSKLNCEPYSVDREQVELVNERCNNHVPINELSSLENEKKNKRTLLYIPMQGDEVSENVEKHSAGIARNINRNNSSASSDNNSSNNNSNNNVSCLPDPKFDSNTNILTMDVDPPCGDLVNDEIPTQSLVPSDEQNTFENPIKIIGIQEDNQNENHSLGVFSKPLSGEETHMSLENSSVVFVNPNVGNVAINQEQSQIIVIPFDYYKSDNGLQNDLGIDSNKDLGLISNEVVSHEKNDIIFQEETTGAPSASHLFIDQSVKSSIVDENIITENDFLRNRQLIYNLEKELLKPEMPPKPRPPKKLKETVQAIPPPVVVVPQKKPTRYRAILPKKQKLVQMNPVVVVHPLLENNKDLTKTKSGESEPIEPEKPKKAVNRRVKKGSGICQKAKESEELKSVEEDTSKSTIQEVTVEQREAKVLPEKEVDIEGTNEEKENLEKAENKKNETPVFVTKRNSKRLSLSTPRRKTHIRALEFETPPKTNKENKKSKTSPKEKVAHLKVERKSVRNTLFKSPTPEHTLKSSNTSKENKEVEPSPPEPVKSEAVEPLNELSIPIATRSPNTKLSDAWENLTGVGCVIGQNDLSKVSPTKKIWDADLRCFTIDNSLENGKSEKKRMRKPEKNQKGNRKSTKKKMSPPKRIKSIPVTVSPSKISLTAKRNTYSINGNEEGSPIRTLIEDLKIVTPFKDMETIRPVEETPVSKLLRENVNTIDIDLSMINTPSFPPTPSIVITPDLEDACMVGTNYYSPTKDCSKEKVVKITDYFKVDSGKTNKKESKEMHEKVIGDLVSKAKEIIGIGKEQQEENALKRRPSGKILSMVKIQMLTQCDKKLMENIPINEETTFSGSFSNHTVIGNVIEEQSAKTDLKVELEEKRKRALRKIKVVKENLSHSKNKVPSRCRKKKKSGSLTKSDKARNDVSKESLDDQQPKNRQESDDSTRKESEIFHSTPYAKNNSEKLEKTDSDKKVNSQVLVDIRQLLPPFENDGEKFPEMSEKSRKKLHYVENFLKLPEIIKFVDDFNEAKPVKLFLKPSLKRFFHIFYKWLKHPHKRELNASRETNAILTEYLSVFDKIKTGLNHKNKRFKRDCGTPNASAFSSSDALGNNASSKTVQSDEEETQWKKRGSEKRKDEDVEDGVVSTLPLKKRKSTVQQVENKASLPMEKNDIKNNGSENVSQTQSFLQDIDVDRFLSQIHGQETR